MSTSDYCVEVEVKVSVADFKKDFLKPKHKFLLAAIAGKSHYIEDLGLNHWSGDIICKYKTGNIRVDKPNYRKAVKHWFYNTWMDHQIVVLRGPCHEIHIHDLTKIALPNKFYFAIPEGMQIKVPDYAGVIRVSEKNCFIEKPAPFIHKRKLEIWKVLLDKFYYKYRGLHT
jgi:hypothetical protein